MAPGFIDIHTHSDLSLLADGRAESKVHQGVTTEVIGNCGFSAFPVDETRVEAHAGLLAMLGDDPVPLRWRRLRDYADALRQSGPALNVVPLIGHGALRIAAMGLAERPARVDELRLMRRLLEEAMAQGAFGLSTGLTYIPSRYSDVDEIAALCDIVAVYEGLYATHARSGAGRALAAAEEAVQVGARSGVRVQYSHAALNEPAWWGRAAEIVHIFEQARADAVDIGFDVYPYDASSSALTQYLPTWVQADGEEAMSSRLGSPRTRRAAREDLALGWGGGIPWYWDRVFLARTGSGAEHLVGRTVAEAATEEGVAAEELVLGLCARYGNKVQVVLFYRTEEDMLTFLRHPLAVVGSDGTALPFSLHQRQVHPRSYGTYPRILGAYVRDREELSLEEAVHKMTGAVADRLRLVSRGRIRPGLAADLVVFNPLTVRDEASFPRPSVKPTGIVHVMVNGVLVIDDTVQTASRPGLILSR